ncbi:MAG: CD225/dispanin family protein [Pyrinomonadaceae bacterium]
MSFLGLEHNKDNPQSIADIRALAKSANLILIFSAISILFCCLGGILATYFAYQAQQDVNAGNDMAAKHNLKIATGWMIATYILGILGIIGKLSSDR